MEHKDTYFLNVVEAIKVAKCNNKVLAPNKQVKATQICYYDGASVKDTPRNCINVPFEEFCNYFEKSKNRIPTEIKSIDESAEKNFESKLKIIKDNIEKKIKNLEEKSKQLQPDFKDKKLRIFAHACRETILIKHIIENIMRTANNMGFEIYMHQQENDLQSCSRLHYLKAYYDFNPHMTININHINNKHLNKNVYNFIWFQDIMPVLTDDSNIDIRDKDVVFHLTEHIGYHLYDNKGVPSHYQPFCIDTTVYLKRQNIPKEKKIVFIGNAYKKAFDDFKSKHKDIDTDKVCNDLFKLYLRDGYIDLVTRKKIIEQISSKPFQMSAIMGYIQRDMSLKYIINMNLDYDIEVYGYGWKDDEEIKKYYKGVLEYGEDISKIYNSAQYGLVIGGYVMQQRTLEAAASEAIPLVFDTRGSNADLDQDCFDESLVFFKRLDDLPNVLQENHNKDLECIVEKNSYTLFIKKLQSIIKKGNK